MIETKISWTDATANFWEGCTKVSDGCRHCYAENRDIRYHEGSHWGKGAPRKPVKNGPETVAALQALAAKGEFQECPDCGRRGRAWELPCTCGCGISRATAPRIFSLSLGDWLDPEVPVAIRTPLFDAIAEAPDCDFMLLTKRPENFRAAMELALCHAKEPTADMIDSWMRGNPPLNVAVGITLEGQTEIERGRPFRWMAIPASRRFISAEPLLGPMTIPHAVLQATDLLIVGGESLTQARPCHPGWVLGLERQALAAGVAFHFKQWGEWAPMDIVPMPVNRSQPATGNLILCKPNGMVAGPNAPVEPADVWFWRAGKRAAGAVLPTIEMGGQRLHQAGLPSRPTYPTNPTQAEELMRQAAVEFWAARAAAIARAKRQK
jgi:protein gp37